MVNKPSHNASVAKSNYPTAQHSLDVADPVACVSIVSIAVNVFCECFLKKLITDDSGKATVDDDELLLTMVWLAVELVVVVLGKLGMSQLVETGVKEVITI